MTIVYRFLLQACIPRIDIDGGCGRSMLHALLYVGFVPVFGLFFLPWIIETRRQTLTD